MRYAGTLNKEDCHFPSLNGRIDTIQAAMLNVVLKYGRNKSDKLEYNLDQLLKIMIISYGAIFAQQW